MSLRTSANRYAKALFDVALQEQADLGQVDRDLQAVVAMIEASPDLAEASNRGTVTEEKRKSLIEAVSRAMTLTVPVTKLLVLLAQSRKLNLLPDLEQAYRERLLAHQNIVQAAVTSAATLSSETLQTLQQRLSDATGKHVQLTAGVDPDLIGGIVTRIGSTVYDGSIRTQLHKLEQQLVDNA